MGWGRESFTIRNIKGSFFQQKIYNTTHKLGSTQRNEGLKKMVKMKIHINFFYFELL